MIGSDLNGMRGCIFDFDGTIIVSEEVHMRAWGDLSKALSVALPDGFLELSVGMSDLQLVKILSEHWRGVISAEEILAQKRAFYMARCPKECVPVDGVVDVILALHSRRVPIAIATSSSCDEVMPVLSRLGIKDFFNGICTVEDVTHPKPDPEIYICAARKIGLKPQQCLAFEDSVAGAKSARAAGCQLITLLTIYDEERLAPSFMSIKDFKDPRILSELNLLNCLT